MKKLINKGGRKSLPYRGSTNIKRSIELEKYQQVVNPTGQILINITSYYLQKNNNFIVRMLVRFLNHVIKLISQYWDK